MPRFRMAANGPRRFSVVGFTFADRELHIPDDEPAKVAKFRNAWRKLPPRYREKITQVAEIDSQGRLLESSVVRGPVMSTVPAIDPGSTSGETRSQAVGKRVQNELGARSSNVTQNLSNVPGAAIPQPIQPKAVDAASSPANPGVTTSTPAAPAPNQLIADMRAVNRAANPMDRDGDGKSGGSLPRPTVKFDGIKIT